MDKLLLQIDLNEQGIKAKKLGNYTDALNLFRRCWC
jgi:hypothetical protein